ncbi:putative branched-chain amino acid ABC transporter (permease protein); livM-like protein [Bradyrhizobium sp. ORS 285]|uniref:branched-chain amino acid ABC transporter permease n=1 Tax=Bradyrhizobium sp. ORS 285 TaxID=115808 RepID=UPI000240A026|nr:branched-chain amino acid ABC transporter permease [Bradyrhizobium sp. ORS 285]CCD86971.1 putative branched-chain amino acid ABC transporter (permease protein); livM-like protein [Bradyrhizobium sp. ORS 285]SMX56897.1 putative branched-chain amino acid ABC transporter (permease protein); livM-like protein [Bradyrhizobium sp. ORS 285]
MTRPRLATLAFIVVALAIVPFLGLSGALLNLMIFMMITALAAQGWNILGGYAGLSSFGHAAFFGVGAYAMAVLQTRFGVNAWIALVIGIALGALVGAAIGFLSFRSGLKGSYFALITLAFAEVARILANSTNFTGGAAGILLKLQTGLPYLQFADRRYFLLIALGFVAIGLLVSWWLEHSRFGAYLVALRENEQAAQALGVDVFAVKMKAIAISGALTAAAGCLYAQNYLFIDANVAFGSWISIEALFAAIVGGSGTVLGPLVGAIVLLGLGELTKSVSGGIPGMDLLVFGVILVLSVAFSPNGLVMLMKSLGLRAPKAKEA